MILVIVHQGWHHVLEPPQSYSDHLKYSHNSIILPEAVWQFQWGEFLNDDSNFQLLKKVSLLPLVHPPNFSSSPLKNGAFPDDPFLLGPEGNFAGGSCLNFMGVLFLV